MGGAGPPTSPARLANRLAGDDFTPGELQLVYETTWGCELGRANFRRKILATDGFVEPTEARRTGSDGGAPAIGMMRPSD